MALKQHYVSDIYWIIHGRQRVKSILRKYITCWLIQGKIIVPTETPSLTSWRLCCNHVFENIGVDFVEILQDPYIVEMISTKNMHKCYILLFTCCVTRAVHLEVRVDVNSANDILALDDLLLNEVGHIYLWEIILKVSNH